MCLFTYPHVHICTLPVEGTQMCNFSLCIRVDELARVFLEKDMRIEEKEERELQREFENKRWRGKENMRYDSKIKLNFKCTFKVI